MAQATDGNPQNPNPQDGGSEGGKLYGGKWKTIEEAVDQGYSGLEKGFHRQAEEISAMRKLIEERLPEQAYNPQPVADYRQDERADQGASREYLSKLYSDPVGFREEIKRETLNDLNKLQAEQTKLQQIFFDWKTDNKDIGDEFALTDFYVRQQPLNLSPRQRLDRAAPFVREHIKRYKTPTSATPSSEDHIEAPGGSPRSSSPAQQKAVNPEQEMANYLAGRAQMRNPKPTRRA